MVVSRRGFLQRGSLLLLGAGTSLGFADRVFGRETHSEYHTPTQGDLSPKGNKPAAQSIFTKATFLPYVNTVFRIYPDSSKVLKTTLVSVGDIGPVPDRKVGRECFVLKFRGTEPLRQNTYQIEHDVLGRFDLFLVPARKNKKTVYYEAVINRLNA